MELALTHWREKMGSNWQPGISWIKGGEGTPQGMELIMLCCDKQKDTVLIKAGYVKIEKTQDIYIFTP